MFTGLLGVFLCVQPAWILPVGSGYFKLSKHCKQRQAALQKEAVVSGLPVRSCCL
jgi:hypothetical protein